jgi:hypothetical protein
MASRWDSRLILALLGCLTILCLLAGSKTQASAQTAASPAAAAIAATAAPTTQAPTTAPPTTAPPTTAPPTTQAPTTAPPTTPAASPTTSSPSPSPSSSPSPSTSPTATPSPAAGSSTSWVPWVFIAVAALALIGLISWFIHAASRRSDVAAAWRSRQVSAYAEGAALHDAIMSAEQRPGAEAGAQWADIQRRANDFSQRLYQLRETAPDEDQAVRVDQVLASLHALRSALDSERASGGVAGMTAGLVRDRLNDFRMSLAGLRDPGAGGR